MSQQYEVSTPPIATLLWVIGCAAMGISALGYFATSTREDGGVSLSITLAAIFSGLLVVGLGSAINYLGRIEQHMRFRKTEE